MKDFESETFVNPQKNTKFTIWEDNERLMMNCKYCGTVDTEINSTYANQVSLVNLKYIFELCMDESTCYSIHHVDSFEFYIKIVSPGETRVINFVEYGKEIAVQFITRGKYIDKSAPDQCEERAYTTEEGEEHKLTCRDLYRIKKMCNISDIEMEDVVKNATTEGVKLLEGQEITGELTMKLKTLLHSCTVSYIDIILYYYDAEHIIKQIDIEIRKRKDFYNFIAEYGNSVVEYWQIESVDGVPYMIFDLKNLVIKGIPTVKPTTKKELAWIIEETIEKEGLNCDLNFIDTSSITDMSWLFAHSRFNGDISKWDVSNVKNMEGMFYFSKFNQDISNWDVSNVWDMRCMFFDSEFNGDISKWDISKVEDMYNVIENCPLGDNPPEWY